MNNYENKKHLLNIKGHFVEFYKNVEFEILNVIAYDYSGNV